MNNVLAGILPQEGGLDATGSGKYTLTIGLLALLTVVGVASGIHALYVGHEHTYGVSRGVPWGILIAAYVFFVVTSTGLCIVSSVGHVFGFKISTHCQAGGVSVDRHHCCWFSGYRL